MEVRCPACNEAIILSRRGSGRPVSGSAMMVPSDRPDALAVTCPACAEVWILDNVVVVVYLARPSPVPPKPVVP